VTVLSGARRSAGGLILALTVTGLAVSGCAESAGSPVVASTAPSPSASMPASPPERTAEVSPEAPSIPLPPDAVLAVDGGDPVVGELGSFSWDNTGSGAPWLPGAPMHIGRGEVLFMALSEPIRLATWTVGRTPAETPGIGIEGIAEGGTGMVMFPAPPSGSWSVNVNVWFADGLGSASYYWLIEVS
jgi:hypothetical protein